MGEDDQMMDVNGSGGEHVSEWEAGLPSIEDLMPLSQALIPPALASAFSITVEPCKTVVDVNLACENTISSLHRQNGSFGNHLKSLPSFLMRDESLVFEGEDGENGVDHCSNGEGHDGRRVRKFSERETEDADSGLRFDNSNDDLSARTLKRPRLVWTPQLHKRFVEVVGHLGIKNAVPKTIMQLMNVEGLTRENVASHLQKYRLYLKRMQGLSNEGPSSSDQLFASTPLPNSLAGPSFAGNHREETSCHMPMPLPYNGPIVPMPAVGVANGHGPHGRRRMPINAPGAYHELESTPYNPFGHAVVPQRMASGEQQRDRSRNKFELSMQYPRITPNDK